MSAGNELSFTILNLCGDGPKEIFKSLEKNVIKLTMHNSHLSFNETALDNFLLPNYTNIYIYLYIYICIYIFVCVYASGCVCR